MIESYELIKIFDKHSTIEILEANSTLEQAYELDRASHLNDRNRIDTLRSRHDNHRDRSLYSSDDRSNEVKTTNEQISSFISSRQHRSILSIVTRNHVVFVSYAYLFFRVRF